MHIVPLQAVDHQGILCLRGIMHLETMRPYCPETTDRVPAVFVENHSVVNLESNDPITVNYDERIGTDLIGLEEGEFLKMTADAQHSGVPTIIYWPDKIKPAKSQALLSPVDFFTSFTKLIGVKIQNAATAVDSYDMLDALMGKTTKGLEQILEEAFTMSIRVGNWKYIAPQTKATPDWLVNKDVKSGLQQTPQLYDLNKDPKEENNLAEKCLKKSKLWLPNYQK